MATSASQPYIARLGFQDPDRSKDRHGLACEYLFERLLELEIAPYQEKAQREYLKSEIAKTKDTADTHDKWLKRFHSLPDDAPFKRMEHMHASSHAALLREALEKLDAANQELESLSLHFYLKQAQSLHKPSDCINVAIRSGYSVAGFADVFVKDGWCAALGEVKITRQPAEQVLQQINFYKSHLSSVSSTYILTDYDCSDLQRLTQGSDVKVFRLGRRFEQWLVMRSTPATPEL